MARRSRVGTESLNSIVTVRRTPHDMHSRRELLRPIGWAFPLLLRFFRGELAQCALEYRARLAARDQVLAIDHDGRHCVNTDLLPELLGRAHLVRERVRVQDLPRAVY